VGWGVGGAGQRTETNCESFPGYSEAGCVREIGRVGVKVALLFNTVNIRLM